MKQDINPGVAALVVLLILAVAGFAIWKHGEPAREAGNKPPGVPADVTAEMNKRLGGGGGMTAPPQSGTPGGSTARPGN